ncbi:MAG: hypothetical protein AAF799_11045 [Myxococcota bacterium]
MTTIVSWLGSLALLLSLGGTAHASALAEPTSATSATSASGAGCDVVHSLTTLGRAQRDLLHRACIEGPREDGSTYAALFRLVSSSGWHAGVVSTILRRHERRSVTAWADGGFHSTPPALVAQERLESVLPKFARGERCPELRNSEDLAEFLDAVGADEEPEELPFTSRFASCVGVPLKAMEGTRLLTIRADGLVDVTVVMGTRDFVHARRFRREEAVQLGGHRFLIVAVPEASPVAVFANHENQELPLAWRGLMGRNSVIWAAPPRRSCLDMSVHMNAGTHLFIDGVRVDGGPPADVCDTPKGGHGPDPTVDRTVAITLDRRGSGVPDHEVAALVCENDRPVVRHLSGVAATAPSEQLRPAGECDTLRLDLSTPDQQRVAVLGVSKLPGCETSPMWATDVQERARHILERDPAHRGERDYANFSAYAEASEALASLETQMGGRSEADSERGADTNALLGSAAQEAWRQGIDTLLSFAVQCTPGEPSGKDQGRWAYSIRATSIHVSDLFARGYYSRDGLDLEDFIDVQSVGFGGVDQQDAALGALLDRIFEVQSPRIVRPPVDTHYRRSQPIRVSRVFEAPEEKDVDLSTPDSIVARFRPIARDRWTWNEVRRGARREVRPRACEELAHRGARSKEAIDAVRETFAEPSNKENTLTLMRSRDRLDISSDPGALVYEGELFPPRPGWYMVVVGDTDEEGVEDAVCVNATAHNLDLWGEMIISGGPLAYAPNGSRALLYLRPRLGATWYLPNHWLGFGFSLGYGRTIYSGTRGDWVDLDVSQQENLQWIRNALLLAPHVEARSRATKLPVELRARLGVAINSGLVDISRVDPALVEFRLGNDEDIVLDLDTDVNLDLGIGVPLGPVMLNIMGVASLSAVDDSLLRSATSVTQDANVYVGFGLGISGGRQ